MRALRLAGDSRLSGHTLRRGIRYLAVPLFVLLLAGALGASVARGDDPKVGLGGGSSFTEGSVLSIPAGTSVPPVHFLLVQNLGELPARVKVGTSSGPGITVNPSDTEFELAPMELKRVYFSVSVSAGTPPGRHKTGIRATVQLPEKAGGVQYAPSVGANFVAVVTNSAATAVVTAVNAQDQSPVVGDLKIQYLPQGDAPFTVAADRGSTLEADVAPGRYRALLDIPGLLSTSTDFTIAKGQTKTVPIEVKALNFLAVGVKPRRDGDAVNSVDLLATVINSLRRIEGPFEFHAIVSRDGQQIDDVLLQQLPVLPNGSTEVRENYAPADGFTPGNYTFDFSVSTPKFTVTAEERPTIEVAAPLPVIPIAAATLLIVLLLALGVLLVRRRKRRQRPPETPAGAPAPATLSAPPPSGPPQPGPPPTGPPHG